MPLGAAIIGGAAVLGAGALTYAGNKHASDTQAAASGQAIDFAKQQEAERVREWNYQQAAAKRAWDVRQANMAPILAARAQVLAKYGINANVDPPPPAPDFTSGPPPGWKPGDPLPAAGGTATAGGGGRSGGGGASGSWGAPGSGINPMLLGAGGITAATLGSLLHPSNPYTNIPQPYTPGALPGEQGGPAGPPAPLPGGADDYSNLGYYIGGE